MKRYFLICVLVLSSVGLSFAQSNNDLVNSFDYRKGAEIMSSENPNTDEALECFKKELEVHPNNGYALYFMGYVYHIKEQEGQALDYVTNSIKYLKKDKDWITYAYRQRAQIYLKLKKDELAIKDWEQSLKMVKNDFETLQERAEYYFGKEKYDLADADYDRIMTSKPNDVSAYIGKARNDIARKNYDKAIEKLNYAISLDPKVARSFAFRAEAYMKQNKYNEASDDLISCLQLAYDQKGMDLMYEFKDSNLNILITKLKVQMAKNKNEAKWPFLIGNVYLHKEEYLKAAEYLKKQNDLDPDDYALYRIARCYEELGDYEVALDYVSRALAEDSTYADYISEKADILYEMNRTNEAIDMYSKYIEQNPDYAGGYYRRAFMKDNTNDIDGAIEDYSTAIVLEPNYAYSYLGRADQYKKKGNIDAAKADYERVIALDTIYSDDNTAQYAYLSLDMKDKAIAFQDSILAHSDSKGNNYDAACLYSRMGDEKKALNYLREAFEKGFRRFAHMANDDDLDSMKKLPEFISLVDEYKAKAAAERQKQEKELGIAPKGKEHISEIPFVRESGVCNVKCKINDLPLHFVFDTGASDVSLSMVEASFMFKNGYLSKDDVVGSAYYTNATGEVTEGTVVILKKVTFGDSELTNVRASVVKNQKAPLLLGQSILSRLGSVELDNAKKVIRIKYYK